MSKSRGALAAAFAVVGLPSVGAAASDFWADKEPHTIVSLSAPATCGVGNFMHVSTGNVQASLQVNADGKELVIAPGRCSSVEHIALEQSS